MYGLLKKLRCACFAKRTSPLVMTDKDIFEKVDSSVDRHTANAARDDGEGWIATLILLARDDSKGGRPLLALSKF